MSLGDIATNPSVLISYICWTLKYIFNSMKSNMRHTSRKSVRHQSSSFSHGTWVGCLYSATHSAKSREGGTSCWVTGILNNGKPRKSDLDEDVNFKHKHTYTHRLFSNNIQLPHVGKSQSTCKQMKCLGSRPWHTQSFLKADWSTFNHKLHVQMTIQTFWNCLSNMRIWVLEALNIIFWNHMIVCVCVGGWLLRNGAFQFTNYPISGSLAGRKDSVLVYKLQISKEGILCFVVWFLPHFLSAYLPYTKEPIKRLLKGFGSTFSCVYPTNLKRSLASLVLPLSLEVNHLLKSNQYSYSAIHLLFVGLWMKTGLSLLKIMNGGLDIPTCWLDLLLINKQTYCTALTSPTEKMSGAFISIFLYTHVL